jgi:two-component system sensor histidine kinase PhcS
MPEAAVSAPRISAELRQSFRDYESDIAFDNSRRAAFIAAVFMLAGTLLDWVILPTHAIEFLGIRAFCAILLGGAYYTLAAFRDSKISFVANQSIALLPLLSICAMMAATEGGNSVYYAGLNLIIVGLSLLLRWTFWNTLW